MRRTLFRKAKIRYIFLAAISLVGIVAIFSGLSPIILIGIYGIIVIIPLVIILLKKDLLYGLLAWLLLVLLYRAIPKIALPMYPDFDLYRIMWILLFLIFFAQIAIKERRLLPITRTEIMMILFCIVCLASMVKAGTIYEKEQGIALRDFLNGYAIPFSIFFLAKHLLGNEQKIKILFQFLLIVGIYLAFTGIFEYFNITGLVFPRIIMDPNVGLWGRARGPFLNAPENGTVLGMIFLASIYLVIHKRKKSSIIFHGIPIVLIPITIFFTYTRACWLGFILSILLVSLSYPRLRKKLFLGFFIIVTIAIFNWSNIMSEDRTVGGVMAVMPVYYRINLYAASLSMFLDRPIFGSGFNTFRKASAEYFYKVSGVPYIRGSFSPHDTMVTILVEVGLVGLIPLLLIFFYIFRHSIGLYHCFPATSFLGKGLIVIFWGISIVFIVNMQFIQMRNHLFPNSLFFLLSGIIVGLNQRISLKKRIG